MHRVAHRSILLIRSIHIGWAGLRSILTTHQEFQAVHEVERAVDGIALAADLQPQIILATDEPAGTGIVRLIQDLRACSPLSKILVVGDVLPPEIQGALVEAGVVGYLVWSSLNAASVPHVLAAVLEGDVVVASRVAVDHLLSPQPQSTRMPAQVAPLTEYEYRTLHHLIAGLTQDRIAATEHLSLREVQRITASLRAKFNAPTLLVAALKAVQLGLVAPLAQTRQETGGFAP